ncbi:diacylglycerol kinase family protein [Colwellia sp. E2M01]|uniref:diacylglycerol kinase family protein n=1 Tax=Colwellia sp. E2M01 TaxID=2841561 RepID=UPI001C0A2CC0|nr:diacylglycerol kinase family protein [Colwellia sp. E2M01]MBU2869634.1 dual specificity protein phosphatase family protein [Colwellia sp. E2M01]
MFIVKYYILGAILAFLALSFSEHFYFKVIWAWIGTSFSLVSLAYLFNLPSIFRKKNNGSIPFYIRWLFIPFLLGVQLYNSWARKNDKVPAVQKIDDNLFLACRLFPSDIPFLCEQKITAILDVTAEFDGLDWTVENEDLDYLNLPVLDHKSPDPEKLIQAIHWIKNHISSKHAVVIHCALGRGRSVLVMAAYLLSQNNSLSVSQVLEKIQGVRATAGLNKVQLKALDKYHQQGLFKLKPPLWIIANPVSGGGKWPEHKAEVIERLSPYFILNILETTKEITAVNLTQKALSQGAKTIIACGGDGTLTEVAAELVNTDITMGILPMGTANALAHVLYGFSTKIIPVSTACDIIISEKNTKIDTAKCNDNLMLLLVGLGFENKMINNANRAEKDLGGQFAYVQALWQAIDKNEVLTLQVKIDDEPPKTIETTSLVIANAAPFTTILAQGGGQPDIKDGLLNLTWLPPQQNMTTNIVGLVELALCGLSEQATPIQSEHTTAKNIEVSAASELKYVIDGEVFSANNLHIEMMPRSLNILANE